jgi:hypothetical protein
VGNVAQIAGFQGAGQPVAQPYYLVDANGNPIGTTNPQAVTGVGIASAVVLYGLASTLESANGTSPDLPVGAYTTIGIDINMTGSSGTSPTVQFFWDRKGVDGVYYPIYQSAVFSAPTSQQLSTSIGVGMTYALSLGLTGRLRWVIGGSGGPSVTFSANVYGK